MKTCIILYKENDPLELPVMVADTITEACKWLGCDYSAPYKSMQYCGEFKANGYILELVNLEN